MKYSNLNMGLDRQQNGGKSLRKLPFLLFFALFFFGVGLVMVIPVLYDYIQTGLVPRFPTLIVSGFLIIVSVLFFFAGLILEVIGKKHRQLFEILMNKRD